jgi:hypothetical protein
MSPWGWIGYGICQVCQKQVWLRKDGLTVGHVLADSMDNLPCAGSRMDPALTGSRAVR